MPSAHSAGRAQGDDTAGTGNCNRPGTQQHPSGRDQAEHQQHADHADVHPTEPLFRQLVQGLGHDGGLSRPRRCPSVDLCRNFLTPQPAAGPGPRALRGGCSAKHQRQAVADQPSQLKIHLRSTCHVREAKDGTDQASVRALRESVDSAPSSLCGLGRRNAGASYAAGSPLRPGVTQRFLGCPGRHARRARR